MEEDIEILEEMKKDIVYDSDEDYDNQIAIRQIKAIENLIKGYRDSEDIMKNAVKENLELKEYIRELEETNKQLDNHTFEFSNEVARDYIPKSKIKKLKEKNEKKIEAMRQFKHSSPFDFGVLNGIDECCRKLLEDK